MQRPDKGASGVLIPKNAMYALSHRNIGICWAARCPETMYCEDKSRIAFSVFVVLSRVSTRDSRHGHSILVLLKLYTSTTTVKHTILEFGSTVVLEYESTTLLYLWLSQDHYSTMYS